MTWHEVEMWNFKSMNIMIKKMLTEDDSRRKPTQNSF